MDFPKEKSVERRIFLIGMLANRESWRSSSLDIYIIHQGRYLIEDEKRRASCRSLKKSQKTF